MKDKDKVFTLRIPIALHNELGKAAKKNDRSINSQLLNWIKEKVNE